MVGQEKDVPEDVAYASSASDHVLRTPTPGALTSIQSP